MAGVKKGLDILVSIGKQSIGGQRNASVEMTSETIDVSCKTTGEWTAKIAGAKSWTAECDGMYFDGDAGYTAALTAFTAGNEVDVKIADSESTVGFGGKAIITSMNIDAPYEDAMTYSISLEGTGELKKASEIE